MTVQVTRAMTASGTIYDFLPDLSRVRRISPEALATPCTVDDDGFTLGELRCDDEWVRIAAPGGIKSPTSLEAIRVGCPPLIITMETHREGASATRYTAPIVSVDVYEMDGRDF